MRSPLLLSMWLLVAGCNEQERPGTPPHPVQAAAAKTAQALTAATPSPDPARRNATSYQEIRGGAVLDEIPISLCKLLKFSTLGAGAYRVKSIMGYTEELLELPGNFDGFTYVELELVADWSGASPSNPVIRITGGPVTVDVTGLWTIKLKVGEVVGALLAPPSTGNRGFPTLHPARLFRKKSDGGYSNGQLFTKEAVALDTIGHTVENLVNLGTACSQQDVQPDLDAPSPGTTSSGEPPPITAPTASASPPADGGLL